MDNSLLFLTLLLLIVTGILDLNEIPDAEAASFKFVNRCHHTVWPGLLSGANSPQLPTTGFTLPPSKSRTLQFPTSWSGRVWARTLCSFSSSNKFSCLTGDCGSGSLHCNGAGAIPPATLAEFTLNGSSGLDFYDVSLVDGYNLPLLVIAVDGSGSDCSPTGCLVDLNRACPEGLRVNATGRVETVACKSACEAFGDPRFCCSGSYSTPDTCGPSVYSNLFKHACPRAYSYAYDDKTSTFTCAGADYTVIFCPPPYTSEKLLGKRRMAGELPLVNKSMMYFRSNGRSSPSTLVSLTFSYLAIALLFIQNLVI